MELNAQMDTKVVEREFANIILALGRPKRKQFLKKVGSYMKTSVRKNFRAGGRPAKWAPLAESTLRRYAYPKHASKTSSGRRLFDSAGGLHAKRLQKRYYRKKMLGTTKKKKARRRKPLMGNKRLVGLVNWKYRSDMGFSADAVEVGLVGRTTPSARNLAGKGWKPGEYLQRGGRGPGRRVLPARPYILFQAEDESWVDAAAVEFVDRALGLSVLNRVTPTRNR